MINKKSITALVISALALSASVMVNQPTALPIAHTYKLFLPMVMAPAVNKCSSAYDNTLDYMSIGVLCAYEWGHTYINAREINVYNSIRSKPNKPMQGYVIDCKLASYVACLQQAATRTTDWLIWNEPDWIDEATSDNLTPTQAAEYYKVISDTVKSVNPNSRFVVGNVLFSFGTWRDDFIKEYKRLYNQDVRQSVYAWGVHDYAVVGAPCSNTHAPVSDACLTTNFAKQLDAHIAWVQANDPNKPIWLTEFNWSPFNEPDQVETARRLPQLCDVIKSRPQIKKYFYFVGNVWYSSVNMSLFNPDGTKSIIGAAYESC